MCGVSSTDRLIAILTAGLLPEGHAGELAIQVRQDLAHSLCSSCGGGYDVSGGSPAAPPVLFAGSIHRLLSGSGGVHRGHQTLLDAFRIGYNCYVKTSVNTGNIRHILREPGWF